LAAISLVVGHQVVVVCRCSGRWQKMVVVAESKISVWKYQEFGASEFRKGSGIIEKSPFGSSLFSTKNVLKAGSSGLDVTVSPFHRSLIYNDSSSSSSSQATSVQPAPPTLEAARAARCDIFKSLLSRINNDRLDHTKNIVLSWDDRPFCYLPHRSVIVVVDGRNLLLIQKICNGDAFLAIVRSIDKSSIINWSFSYPRLHLTNQSRRSVVAINHW
jgi:hypothetical protein